MRSGAAASRATVRKATRMESLPDRNLVCVKHYTTWEWQRLEFGPLKLPAGRNRIQLRALNKPGVRLVDVKALELQRV